MVETKVSTAFYEAMKLSGNCATCSPINSSAISQAKDIVLDKAAKLKGYKEYLGDARKWKASQKNGVPVSFEREVQTHATQALSDAHEIISQTLSATKLFNNSGRINHVVKSFTDGITASGPIQIQDLWNDITNNPDALQTLHNIGVKDELWSAINEDMKKVEGTVFAQDGKLGVQAKKIGNNQNESFFLNLSFPKSSSSVIELLKAGQFEEITQQFEQTGKFPAEIVTGTSNDSEIPNIVLCGCIHALQVFSNHKRKLEDTGLETYSSNDPATIGSWFVASLIVYLIGLAVVSAYCSDIGDDSHDCIIGKILLILGSLGLSFVLGTISGVGLPAAALNMVGLVFILPIMVNS